MTSLEISNIHTTFAEIRAKLDDTPKFTDFSMVNVTIDGDEDDMIALAKYFRGNPIESAVFRNVVATNADVDLGLIMSTILVTSQQLKELCVEDTRFCARSIIASVSYAPRLESIHFVKCDLTDEHAMKLLDALAKASTVTSVDLRGNDFSDFGAHAFTDGLKKKTQVTNVKIDKMTVGEATYAGVEQAAQKKSATAA